MVLIFLIGIYQVNKLEMVVIIVYKSIAFCAEQYNIEL